MRTLVSLTVILLIASLSSQAGTYQWRDPKTGKLHFSDKPPPQNAVEAQDISKKLKRTNSDNSAKQVRQQLDQYQVDQAARSKEQQDNKRNQPAQDEKLRQACAQARKNLRIIKGRVAFIDEQGNPVKVSERERAERAAKLEQQIKERCQNQ